MKKRHGGLTAAIFALPLSFPVCAETRWPECKHENNVSHAWHVSARDNAIQHDSFLEYLSQTLGTPKRCTSSLTTQYEGNSYGKIEFFWPDGTLYRIQTQPIESSEIELISPTYFLNSPQIQSTFMKFSDKTGLNIDWKKPLESKQNGIEVNEYHSNITGSNGIVRFYFNSDKKLTRLSLSYSL